MPSIEVRPFRRSDRDQLTRMVNAHAQAVVPGMGRGLRRKEHHHDPGDSAERAVHLRRH
jgi:hypothetical protein